MESIYIIKRKGEVYKNLNTFYKSKSMAIASLDRHLNVFVPKYNKGCRRIYNYYKDVSVEEFKKDFEIIKIEI